MSEDMSNAIKLFELGLKDGVIQQSGPYYKFNNETIGRGKNAAIELIHKNPDITRKLTNTLQPAPEPQRIGLPVVSSTRVEKPVVDNVDIHHLGEKVHTTLATMPVTTESEGGQKITTVVTKQIQRVLQQPILELHEAKLTGIPKEGWHEYRIDKTMMTAVAKEGIHKGRRWMIKKTDYAEW